ncbi:hypothetical protein G7046_g5161 [Stylonectria norvegica]|nr:hypothetical protein G7046_g5161 [Stylonectria norvegica]
MSGEYTAFFYGTLMAPEVFYSVCYGVNRPAQAIQDLHTFTPAILSDYCRHRVQSADYPAIIAEKGHTVLGIFVTGLTEANLMKLDFFEGSEYDRKTVTVKLVKNDANEATEGESRKASAYVFNSPEFLEKREWDFEEFRNQKMQAWTRGDWMFEQDPDDKAIVDAESAHGIGPTSVSLDPAERTVVWTGASCRSSARPAPQSRKCATTEVKPFTNSEARATTPKQRLGASEVRMGKKSRFSMVLRQALQSGIYWARRPKTLSGLLNMKPPTTGGFVSTERLAAGAAGRECHAKIGKRTDDTAGARETGHVSPKNWTETAKPAAMKMDGRRPVSQGPKRDRIAAQHAVGLSTGRDCFARSLQLSRIATGVAAIVANRMTRVGQLHARRKHARLDAVWLEMLPCLSSNWCLMLDDRLRLGIDASSIVHQPLAGWSLDPGLHTPD